jgi:hypothetical protein
MSGGAGLLSLTGIFDTSQTLTLTNAGTGLIVENNAIVQKTLTCDEVLTEKTTCNGTAIFSGTIVSSGGYTFPDGVIQKNAMKPLEGYANPDTIPLFRGQEYIDLTIKIWWKSLGRLYATDCVCLQKGEINSCNIIPTAAFTPTANWIHASRYMCYKSGIIERLGAYWASNGRCKLAIYSDQFAEPDELLGETLADFDIPYGASDDTKLLTTPIPVVAGTYYWIAFINVTTVQISYNASLGFSRYYDVGSTTFPDEWNTAGDTEATCNYCFFAR